MNRSERVTHTHIPAPCRKKKENSREWEINQRKRSLKARSYSIQTYLFIQLLLIPPKKDCSHHSSLIMHDGSWFDWHWQTHENTLLHPLPVLTHSFTHCSHKYAPNTLLVLCTHWRGQPDRKTLALRFKNGNNSTESKDVHITCSISITSKFPIHHHQQGNFWELEARVKHDMDSHDSTLTSCTRSKLPHVCPREFWHALLIRVDCNTLSSFISSIGVVYRCKPNSLGIHNAATVSF